MKLISFVTDSGHSYGELESPEIIRDWGKILVSRFPDLKAVLRHRTPTEVQALAVDAPVLKLSQIKLLPPIPNPSKILCIGHNYEEHRQEMQRPKTLFPAVFTRFADTQVGSGESVRIPIESTQIDYEGELAVVIGKDGRRIPASDAFAHIAGYSCYNDISVRDWQRHTTQFTPGKNFPLTGAFGPCLATLDELPDPGNLELTTRLNGRVVQHATTAQLIFSIPELIEYCSAFTPLAIGDVIVTGTPGGVGFKRDPPLFMKNNDVVEVEIERIGVLQNSLESERG
jgi:2-keto-4-pentenoate hydratase/2-oxohepta-3-ene-1,7-dioic acid hydratase in catechol pathway